MTIRALIWQVPALALGWLAVLALVALAQPVPQRGAPAFLVLLPSAKLLRDLPQGTAILARSGLSVTVRSDALGFAPQLYAAGAWLVLPAGLKGCAAL